MSNRLHMRIVLWFLFILLLNIVIYIYKPFAVKRLFDSEKTNDNYVQVFSEIYANNVWDTGSGHGSIPKYAEPYMRVLQELLLDDRFNTIVDLGCGDWQFMQHISIPNNKSYLGVDVVPAVINANQAAYAASNIRFLQVSDQAELISKNISGDLLIIKDVLQHWPNSEIKYFLKNILPRFKYALITNRYEQYRRDHNKERRMGPDKSVGLLEAPFKLSNAEILLEFYGPEHKQVLFYTNAN